MTRDEAIKRFACEKCGAAAGEKCLGRAGHPRESVHRERWEKAERDTVPSTAEWWWVIAKFGMCDSCCQPLAGLLMAYRPTDQGKRCEMCVDVEGIFPSKSKSLAA